MKNIVAVGLLLVTAVMCRATDFESKNSETQELDDEHEVTMKNFITQTALSRLQHTSSVESVPVQATFHEPVMHTDYQKVQLHSEQENQSEQPATFLNLLSKISGVTSSYDIKDDVPLNDQKWTTPAQKFKTKSQSVITDARSPALSPLDVSALPRLLVQKSKPAFRFMEVELPDMAPIRIPVLPKPSAPRFLHVNLSSTGPFKMASIPLFQKRKPFVAPRMDIPESDSKASLTYQAPQVPCPFSQMPVQYFESPCSMWARTHGQPVYPYPMQMAYKSAYAPPMQYGQDVQPVYVPGLKASYNPHQGYAPAMQPGESSQYGYPGPIPYWFVPSSIGQKDSSVRHRESYQIGQTVSPLQETTTSLVTETVTPISNFENTVSENLMVLEISNVTDTLSKNVFVNATSRSSIV